MKVIVVRLAPGWLMKNPRGSQHGLTRGLVAGGVAQKPSFERVRAKEPFHPRLFVEHQRAYQVPVPGFVEVVGSLRPRAPTERVELEPTRDGSGQSPRIAGEEEEVGIAPRSMAAVPRVGSTRRGREIPHAKGVAAGKRKGDLPCRSLDRFEQGLGPVTGPLAGPQPQVALSPVPERLGIPEVAFDRGAHRDRPARRERLGHARAQGRDSEQREKPNHSQSMIAHGSA